MPYKMLKKIWDFISKQNRVFLVTFLVGSTYIFIGDTIMYFTPVSALDRYEGVVTSFTIKPYKCSGNKRYGWSLCDKIAIKLNNSSKVFRLSTQEKYEGMIADISVNDEIVVYTKHWYQFILTPGRWNGICQIEKGNRIFYDYSEKKFVYFLGMFGCGLISLVFGIFLIIEIYTVKNLRQKYSNTKPPIITLREYKE